MEIVAVCTFSRGGLLKVKTLWMRGNIWLCLLISYRTQGHVEAL